MARRGSGRAAAALGILLSTVWWVAVTPVVAGAGEPYPSRPITVIVPFAPGGVADLGSRAVSERMSEVLGQRLLVEYKPGGGGTLGASWVAKGKRDGYTVLAAQTGPLVFTPAIKKVEYSIDDFIVIGAYGKVVQWLVVKADSRWNSLKEFVAAAKRRPGELIVSSFGTLTTVDFGIRLLMKHAGVTLRHVPYKSSGEAIRAVLGGNADAAFVTGAGGLLQSGSVRVLAAAEEKRLAALPDVPTFSEFGYPIVIPAWNGYAVATGTPTDVVAKLSGALRQSFERYREAIREDLLKVEVFAAFLDREAADRAFRELGRSFQNMATEFGVVVR